MQHQRFWTYFGCWGSDEQQVVVSQHCSSSTFKEFLNTTVGRFWSEFCDSSYSPKRFESSGRKHVVQALKITKKQIDSTETTLHNLHFSAEGGRVGKCLGTSRRFRHWCMGKKNSLNSSGTPWCLAETNKQTNKEKIVVKSAPFDLGPVKAQVLKTQISPDRWRPSNSLS